MTKFDVSKIKAVYKELSLLLERLSVPELSSDNKYVILIDMFKS